MTLTEVSSAWGVPIGLASESTLVHERDLFSEKIELSVYLIKVSLLGKEVCDDDILIKFAEILFSVLLHDISFRHGRLYQKPSIYANFGSSCHGKNAYRSDASQGPMRDDP